MSADTIAATLTPADVIVIHNGGEAVLRPIAGVCTPAAFS